MLSARVARRLLALGAAFCLTAGAALAQLEVFGKAGQPELHGDNFNFDGAAKEAVVTGHATLTYGDAVLTADEIRFSSGTQAAAATGHVVITSGSRRLVADEASYSTATGIIKARNMRIGQFPIYVTGESVEGTFDSLVFTNATVFFRENARYTPSIHAEHLTYAKGKIVSAQGLGIGILSGHFLHLPKFEQTLDSDFVSYVSAHLGYRGRLGAFAELGLHLPLVEGVKAGADLGLYSARGVMIGPSARYHRAENDNTIDGFLRSGYIHDGGDRGIDFLGDSVPANREYVTWEHRQRYGDHFTLDGDSTTGATPRSCAISGRMISKTSSSRTRSLRPTTWATTTR